MPLLCRRQAAAEPLRVEPPIPPMPPIGVERPDDDEHETEAA